MILLERFAAPSEPFAACSTQHVRSGPGSFAVETEILSAERMGELAAWWTSPPGRSPLYDSFAYARFRLLQQPPNATGGVALVRDGSEPIAALPFRFQRSLGGIPTCRLQTIGFGHASPAFPAAAEWPGRLARLRPEGRRVWTIEIESSVTEARRDRGRRSFARELSGKPGTIRLAGSWDDFVAAQPARLRKHLRSAVRQAERGGWALIDRSREGPAAVERTNELLDSYLNHKFQRAYGGRYRTALRDAALFEAFPPALVRAFALQRGDQVASMLYGVRWGDAFYLLRQGNDPAFFGELSEAASLTLRAALIQDLVGRGVRTLEVVGGTEGLWRTEAPTRAYAGWHVASGPRPVCQRLAGSILRRHRSPVVWRLRRAVGRLSPRLAAHGA